MLAAGAGEATPPLAITTDTSGATGPESGVDRAALLLCQAFVDLATGDISAAHDDARRAVEAEPSGPDAAHSLLIQARSALWLCDVVGAKKALSDMDRFDGRVMAAGRLTTEAGIAALENRREAATAGYATARAAWRALDAPFPLALCELDEITLLGGAAAGAAVVDEAERLLAGLGAIPFLTRLTQSLP
jgi:hypothetical protein